MARKGWREVTNDAKFALLVLGGARFSDPAERIPSPQTFRGSMTLQTTGTLRCRLR